MPWIPFYADESDFWGILDRLNSDPDLAIILAAGRGRWIAKAQLDDWPDGKYSLWHIPGGPLPLLPQRSGEAEAVIRDPFAGWKEQRSGLDATVPFFGSIPNVFELCKATRGVDFPHSIGLSSFGWLGNRYRSLGLGASKETELWWRRTQGWVKQAAVRKIPRWDIPKAPEPEIWAFPEAFRRIEAGTPRDANSHL